MSRIKPLLDRSVIVLLAGALATTSVVLAPTAAHAGDDVAKAARAYRQGQQAELNEDFALASDLYAMADDLAPSGEALRGVVRTALAAERWAVAASAALELERRYPNDAASSELAASTLERTRPLLTELTVNCGEEDCTVVVDGKSADVEPARSHIVFVNPGASMIAGGYPVGQSEAVKVDGAPGESATVTLEPPPPPPEPEEPVPDAVTKMDDERAARSAKRARLSPWYFGIGAVATVGLAAGGIVSGMQAQRAGEDFRNNGRTQALYDEADGLEVQTNILFGVAAGAAVVTGVLAIFTDWNRGKRRRDERSAKVTSGPGTGLGMKVVF